MFGLQQVLFDHVGDLLVGIELRVGAVKQGILIGCRRHGLLPLR